ncbi:MAG TPA: DUF2330 domain-containing protein [Kofleriaceae bacterium]|nr:DUF2330 domain-containing protein [Kofleriaceae bacterium]
MRRFLHMALAVTVLAAAWGSDAGAICREVEETGSSPPVISPDQEILVIRRTGTEVGCDDPADAGPLADAGAPLPDAAPCHTADTITWVVQPRFTIGEGGARFALLMVTPRAPFIEPAPAGIFQDLARATAPLETVENVYVEDPALGYQCEDPKGGSAGCGSTTTTGGNGDWTPPDLGDGEAADAGLPSGYVPVQAIGNYQIVVLAASSGAELAAWFDQTGFTYGAEDIAAIDPYLQLGWVVTAVRVKSDQAVDDGGLEPLAFTFEGDELRLPLAIGRQEGGGRALLRVYLAAEGRYELPGAGIPYAGFSTAMTGERQFLTVNILDRDLSLGIEDDPVAERAPADTPYQESYTRTVTTRVPSSECPSRGGRDDDLDLCGCRLDAGAGGTLVSLLIGLLGAAILWRPRRRRS